MTPLPLPFANFAVCAMSLTTHLLEDVVERSGEALDRMRDDGIDDEVFGNNVLALMLYRDCMLRELERRGIKSRWSRLLEAADGRVLRTPEYRPLTAVPRALSGADRESVRRAIDDHENARIRALPGSSEPGTDGNPGAAT